jgi:hypothetical protein
MKPDIQTTETDIYRDTRYKEPLLPTRKTENEPCTTTAHNCNPPNTQQPRNSKYNNLAIFIMSTFSFIIAIA